MKIAIILVGYNSRNYLDDCLRSLQQATADNAIVIFVDNASKDDSIAFIEREYPHTIIIRNTRNEGFARANNQGVAEARKQGADYIFFLNVDTLIDKACLRQLQQHATQRAIIQPLILLYTDTRTEKVNSAGNVLTYLGVTYCGGYKEPAQKYTTVTPIPLASGAALFIPRAIVDVIGGFDEQFFMYHEDADLSWRARLAGFDILLVPQARVWHKYSFSRNKYKMYWVERNRLFFLIKNFSLGVLVCTLPVFLINEMLVCAYALRSGWLRAKLKSYGSLFIHLVPLMQSRKATQNLRQVSDSQLMKYVSSDMEFSEVKVPLLSSYNKFLHYYGNILQNIFK